METQSLDYIGSITIKSLRDFVLDHHLTDKDTIVLHQHNFDDVVLEYRDTYRESLTNPYIMLNSVLIQQDAGIKVPVERIGVIRNDSRRPKQIRNQADYVRSLEDSEEVVYRCGYCGSIVAADGSELDEQTYKHHREILQARGTAQFVKHTHGACCR